MGDRTAGLRPYPLLNEKKRAPTSPDVSKSKSKRSMESGRLFFKIRVFGHPAEMVKDAQLQDRLQACGVFPPGKQVQTRVKTKAEKLQAKILEQSRKGMSSS